MDRCLAVLVAALASAACTPAPTTTTPAVPAAATAAPPAGSPPDPWPALAGCELPVDRARLVAVPDVIAFAPTTDDRVAIGRALAALGRGSGGAEEKRMRADYETWIGGGAPMTPLQAVELSLDPDVRPDRVLVLTHDALATGPAIAVVASLAGSDRWIVLLEPFLDPALRVLATANIDADPWVEMVLVQRSPSRRHPWWLTADDRGGRFPHIEPGGASDCASDGAAAAVAR